MTSPSSPVQHADMRASNLALVLGAIAADDGALTRAQVAARTGLTKSTVSGFVAELVTAGLVSEGMPAPTYREPGRPGTVLQLDGRRTAGLGLEIGVDYLIALVTDLTGTVRHRHVVNRENRGSEPREVLARLRLLATAAAHSAAEQGLNLAGACIAVPGVVAGDRVLRAPNLGWAGVPVDLPLEGLLLETKLENEANLAALAEHWSGTVPSADFVHVSGEIGIGGGIVVGGQLFRGAHARAGELGHVVVDPDGPPCSCGGYGCVERFAGQDAILVAAGAASRAELEERCQAGDSRALESVSEAGRWLGIALASVANLFDPDVIVLGGVFAALAPWLREAVADNLARHGVSADIVVSQLGTEAAVRGAAGAVVHEVIADPARYLRI